MVDSVTTIDEFGRPLERLATFVHELEYEDIPNEVLTIERRHVLDTLGCILYGSTTPWVRKVAKACDALGESGGASILGLDQSVSPARAALVNGTAAHSMDYDDHCQDAGVHAGSATIPPLLAYAETNSEPVDGCTFLTAVTAGVEVGIRSGFGIGYGSVGRGWHIPGWTGAFASAATIGKLYDLDIDQLAHALVIAGTQGCGLLGAQYGAEVKRFHMGKAAEAGFLGAALARESFTGDTRIFQERYGAIGPTMSDNYNIDAVVEELGERYRILDKLTFKPFPSVGQVHAAVDAVRELLDRESFSRSEVSSVTVRVTPTVKDHVGWEYEPTDVMSAQSNLQYGVATLLVDGEVTIDSYTSEAIGRERVLERIEDISVVIDESLEETTFGSAVELTAAGDRFHNEVDEPRGYPSNPLDESEIRDKFTAQAEKRLSQSAIADLEELIFDLEEIGDVKLLIEYCRPTA